MKAVKITLAVLCILAGFIVGLAALVSIPAVLKNVLKIHGPESLGYFIGSVIGFCFLAGIVFGCTVATVKLLKSAKRKKLNIEEKISQIS